VLHQGGTQQCIYFCFFFFFTLGTRAVGPPCIVVTMQKINWLTLLFTLFASSYFDKVLAGLDSNWMCVGIDRGDFR